MKLRLILGRAGSGKSSLCLREITEKLRDSPRGPALVYLVPEQATFQAEYALATHSFTRGSIRGQVLSFRRLAWRVLQETGGEKRLFIDDTGKSLLLQRALERLQEDLKVFKGASRQKGAIENILQLYNELKRSHISLTRLHYVYHAQAKDIATKGPSHLFRDKVEDLLLLYGELEKSLQGHYLDAEDYLALLVLKVPSSAFLQRAVVWVDGFYSFTNQEYAVLENLLKHCHQVNITICLGRDCSAAEQVEQLDPFYPAVVTCRKLQQIAENNSIPVQKKILSGAGITRFSRNQVLSFLEQNLHIYPPPLYPSTAEERTAQERTERPALRLVSSPNRRSEVESIAREALALVRDHGYRWRDIAVMAGDLEHYRHLIAAVFTDYDIPFFLDLERPARDHPLVEFVRSALEVVNRRWRYEDIFRCLKTDFPLPLSKSNKWRERVDRLENYVLAFGLQGERWLQKEPWAFRKRDLLESGAEEGEDLLNRVAPGEKQYLKLVNATRKKVSAPLLSFYRKSKGLSTVREKCQALYELLEEVEVQRRLEMWMKEAAGKGFLQEAREHGQVFEGILGLLDQMVEVIGEEEITADFFGRLLEAGLDSLYFSLVPPSLDQVLVGSIERTRSSSVKCAFILGANEGLLPSRPGEDGIFSEEEREELQEWGLDIPPGSRRQLLDEQFLIYMAMTRASSELRLSYALADEEGGALVPSLLVARVKDLFPGLQEEFTVAEPLTLGAGADFFPVFPAFSGQGEIFEKEDKSVLPFVAHPQKTFSHLVLQLSRWKKGFVLHPLWWEIYNWYAEKQGWHLHCRRLLESLFYSNREKYLNGTLSGRIYGSQLKTSVSRLERFSSCPFAHFASYGLGLKERQLYNLELPDLGRFFHASLRNIAHVLEEKKKDWAELDREQSFILAAEEVEKLAPLLQEEILLSSGRYRYLAEKIKRTVGRAVFILGEHARRGSFRPVGVEVAFGEKGELPAISFTLPEGFKIKLEGRIDRVDLAQDAAGNSYVRIIDYKSGGSELDLKEVFYGISLQILVYLDVVLTNAAEWLHKNVLPAGVFFFRLYSPMLSSAEALSPEEMEEEMLKRYRLKGRALHDARVVRLMDSTLEKGYSAVIPAGLKKNDELYEKSSTLMLEQFDQLRKYVKGIIQEIAAGIVSGRVDIRPYRLGSKKPCPFCQYKAVCQFDPLLEGNSFRLLKGVEEEQLWSWIETAVGIEAGEKGENGGEGMKHGQ